MKLWGGRFKKEEDRLMEDFNSSLPVDRRLYEEDITGSIAHVKMLKACELLSEAEADAIIEELHNILSEINTGSLEIGGGYEDIHSFIEGVLTDRLGEAGKKLHTARSRNDQVALDLKLYTKKQAMEVIACIEELTASLKEKAEQNNVLMPGYTHLQRAQIVTFGYHLKAYMQMFNRDKVRIENTMNLLNESPLGSGALAGTTHNINREMTADLLGFARPAENFLDGVSDRDYVIEFISDLSIVMMHLSRLSEELILWSSQEFSFIEMDDAYSTGSSIMPQKKNPDAAELIRGKTGRVYGSLMSILTTMKGLPLAYNKDMQEDKEPLFNALDTAKSSLSIMSKMIATLKVNGEQMKKAMKHGFLNATEVADYLVSKGEAFRDAHGIVGQIVIYCEAQGKGIEDLTLNELQQFSSLIDQDMYDYIAYENILKRGNKQQIK
jgi:argininosuccinate lyase